MFTLLTGEIKSIVCMSYDAYGEWGTGDCSYAKTTSSKVQLPGLQRGYLAIRLILRKYCIGPLWCEILRFFRREKIRIYYHEIKCLLKNHTFFYISNFTKHWLPLSLSINLLSTIFPETKVNRPRKVTYQVCYILKASCLLSITINSQWLFADCLVRTWV